jgi:DMSO/TMAO reductase YedYZ molybdopterin-dependent catalytic subunit
LRRWLPAALTGLVAGSAAALLEVGARSLAGLPLPSELIADRVLPMIPVDAFLSLLGRMGGPIAAKEEAFWGGFAGVVGAAVVAALALELLRRRPWGARASVGLLVVPVIAVVAGLFTVLDSNYAGLPSPAAALAAATGLLAALAIAVSVLLLLTPKPGSPDGGRRQVLKSGAALALLAATAGLGWRLFQDGTFTYDGMRLFGRGRTPVTPVGDFYIVTKNLVDPEVNESLWRLEIGGSVAQPFSLDLDRLRAFQAQTQETTLECISNGVAYGLISNAIWRGPSLKALLDKARPAAGARVVDLRGVDGYIYTLSLERALRGDVLVAHEMNGAPLTRRHGAPARAVVPGAYGEASAKWLTAVTVLDHQDEGYYERQGWLAERVHTTSVIDEPSPGTRVATGRIMQVRGVAFAGDRGVSRVEVSTDGGDGWRQAHMVYSEGPLTWVLWSIDWAPQRSGPALLMVRAYDGAGAIQETVHHGFVPSGATGLHSVQVVVA